MINDYTTASIQDLSEEFSNASSDFMKLFENDPKLKYELMRSNADTFKETPNQNKVSVKYP